ERDRAVEAYKRALGLSVRDQVKVDYNALKPLDEKQLTEAYFNGLLIRMVPDLDPDTLEELLKYDLLTQLEFLKLAEEGKGMRVEVAAQYAQLGARGSVYAEVADLNKAVISKIDKSRAQGNLQKAWNELISYWRGQSSYDQQIKKTKQNAEEQNAQSAFELAEVDTELHLLPLKLSMFATSNREEVELSRVSTEADLLARRDIVDINKRNLVLLNLALGTRAGTKVEEGRSSYAQNRPEEEQRFAKMGGVGDTLVLTNEGLPRVAGVVTDKIAHENLTIAEKNAQILSRFRFARPLTLTGVFSFSPFQQSKEKTTVIPGPPSTDPNVIVVPRVQTTTRDEEGYNFVFGGELAYDFLRPFINTEHWVAQKERDQRKLDLKLQDIRLQGAIVLKGYDYLRGVELWYVKDETYQESLELERLVSASARLKQDLPWAINYRRGIEVQVGTEKRSSEILADQFKTFAEIPQDKKLQVSREALLMKGIMEGSIASLNELFALAEKDPEFQAFLLNQDISNLRQRQLAFERWVSSRATLFAGLSSEDGFDARAIAEVRLHLVVSEKQLKLEYERTKGKVAKSQQEKMADDARFKVLSEYTALLRTFVELAEKREASLRAESTYDRIKTGYAKGEKTRSQLFSALDARLNRKLALVDARYDILKAITNFRTTLKTLGADELVKKMGTAIRFEAPTYQPSPDAERVREEEQGLEVELEARQKLHQERTAQEQALVSQFQAEQKPALPLLETLPEKLSVEVPPLAPPKPSLTVSGTNRVLLPDLQHISEQVFGMRLPYAWQPDVEATGKISGTGQLEIPEDDPSVVRIHVEDGGAMDVKTKAFVDPSHVEIVVKNGGKIISEGSHVKILDSSLKIVVEGTFVVADTDQEIKNQNLELTIPKGELVETGILTAPLLLDKVFGNSGRARDLSDSENGIRMTLIHALTADEYLGKPMRKLMDWLEKNKFPSEQDLVLRWDQHLLPELSNAERIALKDSIMQFKLLGIYDVEAMRILSNLPPKPPEMTEEAFVQVELAKNPGIQRMIRKDMIFLMLGLQEMSLNFTGEFVIEPEDLEFLEQEGIFTADVKQGEKALDYAEWTAYREARGLDASEQKFLREGFAGYMVDMARKIDEFTYYQVFRDEHLQSEFKKTYPMANRLFGKPYEGKPMAWLGRVKDEANSTRIALMIRSGLFYHPDESIRLKRFDHFMEMVSRLKEMKPLLYDQMFPPLSPEKETAKLKKLPQAGLLRNSIENYEREKASGRLSGEAEHQAKQAVELEEGILQESEFLGESMYMVEDGIERFMRETGKKLEDFTSEDDNLIVSRIADYYKLAPHIQRILTDPENGLYPALDLRNVRQRGVVSAWYEFVKAHNFTMEGFQHLLKRAREMRPQVEEIYKTITMSGESGFDISNPGHMGLLMAWAYETSEKADMFVIIVKSETFNEYMKKINREEEDYNFRIKLKEAFLRTMRSNHPEVKGMYLELAGRVSFLSGQFETIEDLEKEFKRRIELIDDIEREFKKSPASILQKIFQNFKIGRSVQVGSYEVDNLYALNEALFLMQREVVVKREGRLFNADRERNNFKTFFLEIQVATLPRVLEKYQVDFRLWHETVMSVFKALENYPIEYEFDSKLELKFRDFVEGMRGDGIDVNDPKIVEALKNYFIYNQLVSTAGQWFDKMLTSSDNGEPPLKLRQVIKRINARKATWRQYQEIWKDSDLTLIPLIPGQVSYVADLGFGEKQLREFFEDGRKVFSTTKLYLGRSLIFDELVNDLTLYSKDMGFYWRSLGGRIKTLADYRLNSKYVRMDQKDPKQLERMLKHAPVEHISMLKVDDTTEKLRFVLSEFARKVKMHPEDEEMRSPEEYEKYQPTMKTLAVSEKPASYDAVAFRQYLLRLLGQDLVDHREHYTDLLDAVSKVPVNFEAIIFGARWVQNGQELGTEEGLVEFVVRQISNRPADRALTKSEKNATNEQFVILLTEQSHIDRGFWRNLTNRIDRGNLFASKYNFVQMLNEGQLTRERLKAIFNDYKTLYETIIKQKSYDSSVDMTKLLDAIVRERLNGNIPALTSMKYEAVKRFLTELDEKRSVVLSDEERTGTPSQQVAVWIRENQAKISAPLSKEVEKELNDFLATILRDGYLDRASTKRLVEDLFALAQIYKRYPMHLLSDKNEITFEVLKGFIRTVDDVYVLGLQDNGVLEKPSRLRDKKLVEINQYLEKAKAYNATRQVEDEMYLRFRMYNPSFAKSAGKPDSLAEAVGKLEYSSFNENVQSGVKWGGYLLLGLSVWLVLRVILAHIVAWHQRRSATIERDEAGKRIKGGGRENVDRIKVKKYPPGLTLKMSFYFFVVVAQLVVSSAFYLLIMDWTSLSPVIVLMLTALFTALNIGAVMTVMDRLTTSFTAKRFAYFTLTFFPPALLAVFLPIALLNWFPIGGLVVSIVTILAVSLYLFIAHLAGWFKRIRESGPKEPERKRVSFENNLLPSNRKVGVHMVTLLKDAKAAEPVVQRLVNSVRAQNDPNIFGLLYDKGESKPEEREAIKDMIRGILWHKPSEQLNKARRYIFKDTDLTNTDIQEILDLSGENRITDAMHNLKGKNWKKDGKLTPIEKEERESLIGRIVGFEKFYGIKLYYLHSTVPGGEDIEKKFGAHTKIYRFLYEGITQSTVDAERYIYRTRSINSFPLGGIIGVIASVILLTIGISNPFLWGSLVGLASGFVLALITSGQSKTDQSQIFDDSYGQWSWLGFRDDDYKDIVDRTLDQRFKTRLVRNGEAPIDKTYEMADNYDRVWALFLLDDKNFAGYTSYDKNGRVSEHGLIRTYRSGRESGIREAIRQELADTNKITNKEAQDREVEHIVHEIDAAGINLDSSPLAAIQSFTTQTLSGDEWRFAKVNVTQYSEEYIHYQPVRKAVEVMSHKDNRWAAYGNVFIEITGDASQWAEENIKFAKIGIAFDESKKINLPVDNEYGKAMVVPARWLQGTEPQHPATLRGIIGRAGWHLPMFLIGTVGGSIIGFLAGAWLATILNLPILPPLILGGYGAYLGLLLGMFLGVFEGRFYKGVLGMLQVGDTTHDSREAAYGGAVNVIRAGVFEPAVTDIKSHIDRALLRWDSGEKRSWWYIYGPGVPLASRWHSFMATRMYTSEIKFFIWLTLSIFGAVVWSGMVDTFFYTSRLIEFAYPVLAWVLLVYMILSIIFSPNFVAGTGTLFRKLLAGYGENLERNRVGTLGRTTAVQRGTLIYMNLPFLGAIYNIRNKFRVMITGPHPRIDSTKISPLRKVTGFMLGLGTIPLLWYLQTFGLSVSTVLFTVFGVPIPIFVAVLGVTFVLSAFLMTPVPVLMTLLVYLGPAYFLPPVYIAVAAVLGLLFVHRLSGRYITLPWLFFGLTATALIAGIPAIPFVAGAVFNQFLSWFPILAAHPIILKSGLAFFGLIFISRVLLRIVYRPDALIRETLPWVAFGSLKGTAKSPQMVQSAKRFGLSFAYGLLVVTAAVAVMSNLWVIGLVFPLLFSWFRGSIRSWIMDKQGKGKEVADRFHRASWKRFGWGVYAAAFHLFPLDMKDIKDSIEKVMGEKGITNLARFAQSSKYRSAYLSNGAFGIGFAIGMLLSLTIMVHILWLGAFGMQPIVTLVNKFQPVIAALMISFAIPLVAAFAFSFSPLFALVGLYDLVAVFFGLAVFNPFTNPITLVLGLLLSPLLWEWLFDQLDGFNTIWVRLRIDGLYWRVKKLNKLRTISVPTEKQQRKIKKLEGHLSKFLANGKTPDDIYTLTSAFNVGSVFDISTDTKENRTLYKQVKKLKALKTKIAPTERQLNQIRLLEQDLTQRLNQNRNLEDLLREEFLSYVKLQVYLKVGPRSELRIEKVKVHGGQRAEAHEHIYEDIQARYDRGEWTAIEAVEEMFRRQVEIDHFLKGYRATDEVIRNITHHPMGEYYVGQINPARKERRKGAPGTKPGCLICVENMPPNEKGFRITASPNQQYLIVPNPFPVAPYHMAMLWPEHKRQFMDEKVLADVIHVARQLPGIDIAHNGFAGASIPDHQHFHVYKFQDVELTLADSHKIKGLPLDAYINEALQNPAQLRDHLEKLYETPEIQISKVHGWNRTTDGQEVPAYALEAKDETVLAGFSSRFLQVLAETIPDSTHNIKVLASGSQESDPIRLIIFPRNRRLHEKEIGMQEMAGYPTVAPEYEDIILRQPLEAYKKVIQEASIPYNELRPVEERFLELARAEVRADEIEKTLLKNLGRNEQFLKNAIQGKGPDFSEIDVATTQSTEEITRLLLENDRGESISNNIPARVIGGTANGTILTLLDFHKQILVPTLGANYSLKDLRGKSILYLVQVGPATRMKVSTASLGFLNKGLELSPGGDRTNLEQRIWERGFYYDPEGLVWMSVDAAHAPYFESPERMEVVDPIIENGRVVQIGKGGVQVFVYPAEVDVNNTTIINHGVFVTRNPLSPEPQEIFLAIEKPGRLILRDRANLDFLKEQLEILKRRGVIEDAKHVFINTHDFKISWPTYLFLIEKFKGLEERFPNHPPINWIEAFLEAMTLGNEFQNIYRDRHPEFSDVPGLIDFLTETAQTVRDTYGVNTINLGKGTIYSHTNTPYDAERVIEKFSPEVWLSSVYRRMYGVYIVGRDPWALDISEHRRFVGMIIGPNVKIDPLVEREDLNGATVLGASIIQHGTYLNPRAIIFDSAGVFDARYDDVFVRNRLAPNRRVIPMAGYVMIDYFILDKEKKERRQITANVPVRFNPWQVVNGKIAAENFPVSGYTLAYLLSNGDPEATRLFRSILSPKNMQHKSFEGILAELEHALESWKIGAVSRAEVRRIMSQQAFGALLARAVNDHPLVVRFGPVGMGSSLLPSPFKAAPRAEVRSTRIPETYQEKLIHPNHISERRYVYAMQRMLRHIIRRLGPALEKMRQEGASEQNVIKLVIDTLEELAYRPSKIDVAEPPANSFVASVRDLKGLEKSFEVLSNDQDRKSRQDSLDGISGKAYKISEEELRKDEQAGGQLIQQRKHRTVILAGGMSVRGAIYADALIYLPGYGVVPLLAIKILNVLYTSKRFGVDQPRISIAESDTTYRYVDQALDWLVSRRFIKNKNEIDRFLVSMPSRLDYNGDYYKPSDIREGYAPASHFDAVRYYILSGRFGDDLRDGVEVVSFSNMNIPTATLGLKVVGHLSRLAEEAKKAGKTEPGVLLEFTENQSEKGGFFALVYYLSKNPRSILQSIEGFLMQKGLLSRVIEQKKQFPIFNTNSEHSTVGYIGDFFELSERELGFLPTTDQLEDKAKRRLVLEKLDAKTSLFGEGRPGEKIATFPEVKKGRIVQLSRVLSNLFTTASYNNGRTESDEQKIRPYVYGRAIAYFVPRQTLKVHLDSGEEVSVVDRYAEAKTIWTILQNPTAFSQALYNPSQGIVQLPDPLENDRPSPETDQLVLRTSSVFLKVHQEIKVLMETKESLVKGLEKNLDTHNSMLNSRKGLLSATEEARLVAEIQDLRADLQRVKWEQNLAANILNEQFNFVVHMFHELQAHPRDINTINRFTNMVNRYSRVGGLEGRFNVLRLEQVKADYPTLQVYPEDDVVSNTADILARLNREEVGRLIAHLQRLGLDKASGRLGIFIGGGVTLAQFRELMTNDFRSTGHVDVSIKNGETLDVVQRSEVRTQSKQPVHFAHEARMLDLLQSYRTNSITTYKTRDEDFENFDVDLFKQKARIAHVLPWGKELQPVMLESIRLSKFNAFHLRRNVELLLMLIGTLRELNGLGYDPRIWLIGSTFGDQVGDGSDLDISFEGVPMEKLNLNEFVKHWNEMGMDRVSSDSFHILNKPSYGESKTTADFIDMFERDVYIPWKTWLEGNSSSHPEYKAHLETLEAYKSGLNVHRDWLKQRSEVRAVSAPSEQVKTQNPRTIAFVAMESGLEDLPKAGGQYDYVRDLSRHLAKRGHGVIVVSPNFPDRDGIKKVKRGDAEKILSNVPFQVGRGIIYLDVLKVTKQGVTYYLLDDSKGDFFQGLYKESNGLRGLIEAVLLSNAVFYIARTEHLDLDLIHANDWQAGLAPVYLQEIYQQDFAKTASVFTSHNMAYQGVFNGYLLVALNDRLVKRLVADGVLEEGLNLQQRRNQTIVQIIPDTDDSNRQNNLLNLPYEIITRPDQGLEYHAIRPVTGNKFSLMKGLMFADRFNAVSRGNLQELTIAEVEGGTAFGFEGIMQQMTAQGRVAAVFNGVEANPAKDPYLRTDGYVPFNDGIVRRKVQNKLALIQELEDKYKFDVSEKDFLLFNVGRITQQKGLSDFKQAFIEKLAALRGPRGEKVKLVILGATEDEGGKKILAELNRLSGLYPDLLKVIVRRDPKLASRLNAGGDAFIMPSHSEPGGIANQIANRYGVPVIAPKTGGLQDFFDEWGGVGFTYEKFDPRRSESDRINSLVAAITEVAQTYWNKPSKWETLVRRAAKYNASWDSRVELYEKDVYEPAINSRRSELRTGERQSRGGTSMKPKLARTFSRMLRSRFSFPRLSYLSLMAVISIGFSAVKAWGQGVIGVRNPDRDSTPEVDVSVLRFPVEGQFLSVEELVQIYPEAVLIVRTYAGGVNDIAYLTLKDSSQGFQSFHLSQKAVKRLKGQVVSATFFASIDLDGPGKVFGTKIGKGAEPSIGEAVLGQAEVGAPGELLGQNGQVVTIIPPQALKLSTVRLTIDVSQVDITKAENLLVQIEPRKMRVVNPNGISVKSLAPAKSKQKVFVVAIPINPADIIDDKLTVTINLADVMEKIYGANLSGLGLNAPAALFINPLVISEKKGSDLSTPEAPTKDRRDVIHVMVVRGISPPIITGSAYNPALISALSNAVLSSFAGNVNSNLPPGMITIVQQSPSEFTVEYDVSPKGSFGGFILANGYFDENGNFVGDTFELPQDVTVASAGNPEHLRMRVIDIDGDEVEYELALTNALQNYSFSLVDSDFVPQGFDRTKIAQIEGVLDQGLTGTNSTSGSLSFVIHGTEFIKPVTGTPFNADTLTSFSSASFSTFEGNAISTNEPPGTIDVTRTESGLDATYDVLGNGKFAGIVITKGSFDADGNFEGPTYVLPSTTEIGGQGNPNRIRVKIVDINGKEVKQDLLLTGTMQNFAVDFTDTNSVPAGFDPTQIAYVQFELDQNLTSTNAAQGSFSLVIPGLQPIVVLPSSPRSEMRQGIFTERITVRASRKRMLWLLAGGFILAGPLRVLARSGEKTIKEDSHWRVLGASDTGLAQEAIQVGNGRFTEIKVLHKGDQIYSVKGNGFLRGMLPLDFPGLPNDRRLDWGTSFVLPGYWSGDGAYHHNPRIVNATFDIENGLVVMKGVLRDLKGNFEAHDFRIVLHPPDPNQGAVMEVSFTLKALKNFQIDPTRLRNHEGFKIAQFSSMNIGRAHDADFATYEDEAGNLARSSLNKRNQLVFNNPRSLGKKGIVYFANEQPSEGRYRPTTYLRFAEDMNSSQFTPQGWVEASNDVNDDNVGVWIHAGTAKGAYRKDETILRAHYFLGVIPPGKEFLEKHISRSEVRDLENIPEQISAASLPPTAARAEVRKVTAEGPRSELREAVRGVQEQVLATQILPKSAEEVQALDQFLAEKIAVLIEHQDFIASRVQKLDRAGVLVREWSGIETREDLEAIAEQLPVNGRVIFAVASQEEANQARAVRSKLRLDLRNRVQFRIMPLASLVHETMRTYQFKPETAMQLVASGLALANRRYSVPISLAGAERLNRVPLVIITDQAMSYIPEVTITDSWLDSMVQAWETEQEALKLQQRSA
ncbi:MAG: glycogen/starch synthase, partial [Candidatus Omnitrophica bacterium]|nr:glycogen/starch synthase [Candidatus Omnitrophota bacterium]